MRLLGFAIAMALFAQLSLALYSSNVPIGVFQGKTDTTMPTALLNAGFTNVTVVDLNNMENVDLTRFRVLVYAPDVGMDSGAYAKLTGSFKRISRLLHSGRVNVLVMGQPYQHTYYFLPFYECVYPCPGNAKDRWSVDYVAEPHSPFWRYPNALTQADLNVTAVTIPHYMFQRAGNSYTDGRVLASTAGDYPVVAEMRWGTGKVLVNAFNNGCVGQTCATQYYKFLQNSIAYLSSVDISAPVRASLDGANVTVTVSGGQATSVRLILPRGVAADASEKPLSGNSATFSLTAAYPGIYTIKAEAFGSVPQDKAGEAWKQIGFVSTNVAPRLALIEPRYEIATEEALDMMGYAYTVFDSSNVNSINFSAYDLIIVDYDISYRDSALRTALINLKTNITNWVNAGGKLLIFGQPTNFQEFAPITTSIYGSPSKSTWAFQVIDPSHQVNNYPHPFTNYEYSVISQYWNHWMFSGINGIEGEHPFSYDIAQNHQMIGIKNVGSGRVVGVAFVPDWYRHDNPSMTELQHDYQVQLLDNLIAALSPNFTGYQKNWYAYNVRAVRCSSTMPNANVTVYLPGTATVVDSALGDSIGNAIVHVDYGTYDVKITLQDGTFKAFPGQVFN